MIVEVVLDGAFGREPPLVLRVTQVVAYQDNGTPVALLAEGGPERSQVVTMIGQEDFRRQLRAFGVASDVRCDRIVLPRPAPGARLVAGPTRGE